MKKIFIYYILFLFLINFKIKAMNQNQNQSRNSISFQNKNNQDFSKINFKTYSENQNNNNYFENLNPNFEDQNNPDNLNFDHELKLQENYKKHKINYLVPSLFLSFYIVLSESQKKKTRFFTGAEFLAPELLKYACIAITLLYLGYKVNNLFHSQCREDAKHAKKEREKFQQLNKELTNLKSEATSLKNDLKNNIENKSAIGRIETIEKQIKEIEKKIITFSTESNQKILEINKKFLNFKTEAEKKMRIQQTLLEDHIKNSNKNLLYYNEILKKYNQRIKNLESQSNKKKYIQNKHLNLGKEVDIGPENKNNFFQIFKKSSPPENKQLILNNTPNNSKPSILGKFACLKNCRAKSIESIPSQEFNLKKI